MKDTLPNRVRLGAFELDLRAGVVRTGEESVCLQQQPFFVLRMLVERGGEIVTRDEIQKKLWPNDTAVDFDQGINKAIRKLRQVLGDSAEKPIYIETVARRGYRLLPCVVRVRADDSSDAAFAPEYGKSTEHPAGVASLIGEKVSHYRVLKVLGGGGMGMVYKAEDLKLGRCVALKFLPSELANDSVALQRFEREAQTASSLNHPNICTIHEIEDYKEQPFIVMELLEGKTLRDLLAANESKALPLDQLLDIAIQIGDGLQAAHEKGIIHRDIKPANIFITNKGVCKILDFGLAKLLETGDGEQAMMAASAEVDNGLKGYAFGRAAPDSPPLPSGLQPATDLYLTRTGSAMGTAGYMSPEQVRGEKLDARTDIFSFGLVLYELATGERAFSADTAAVVQDAILNQTPAPAHEVNSTIPPKLEQIINRAIEKDREQRYQSAAEIRADLQDIASEQSSQVDARESKKRFRWKSLTAAAAFLGIVIMASGLYWYWRSHRPPKLTERDSIVVADFDNKTGDAIFDDSLKQGLSVQLEQTPFLALVSDRKVNQTLKEMGRLPGDRLTPEIAREVCQRTGSRATLTGSIAASGNAYVIDLKTLDCDMGDLLADVEERATNKDAVLGALDNAVVGLRRKLGESLNSVQRYGTPLQEATTPSLEALNAYSIGYRTAMAKGAAFAMPFYERAVELDPNFALAYARLSSAGVSPERKADDARRAYELREKVSERERLYIEATYYLLATGELERAAQVEEVWRQTYPRNDTPYVYLGYTYGTLGDSEKALRESREAVRFDPNNSAAYRNLAFAYQCLNRLDEAEAVYKKAQEHDIGTADLLHDRYQLAFLKRDAEEMRNLAEASAGKPGFEDALLALEGDTAAWNGKFRKARKLNRRAMDSAEHNDARETAAAYKAAAGLREVESGNPEQALADAHAALKMAPNRDVRMMAALIMARVGDVEGAEKLAAELDREFPLATRVQEYWLPTIRAAVALQRKEPQQAVELLKVAIPVELGDAQHLIPVYVRGEAYLMLHDSGAAAAEFQKFIDHYGLVVNFTWGALARLGLARAYAIQAATDPAARDKARTAYQNFLTLWKDADPDIPIYKQAKAEYAKLQ